MIEASDDPLGALLASTSPTRFRGERCLPEQSEQSPDPAPPALAHVYHKQRFVRGSTWSRTRDLQRVRHPPTRLICGFLGRS